MSKPLLILISGWACSSSALRGLARALADHFSVIRTSTHELGAEAGSDSCYVEGLRLLIERAGPQAMVAGWSMGGMVALQTAARYPDLIRALVLIGACAKFCSDPDSPEGAPRSRVRAMASALKKEPQTVLRRFFEQSAWPAEETEMDDKVSSALSMNVNELISGLDYLQRFDLRRDLPVVNIPALAIHGKADRIVPWEASGVLCSRLPDCRLAIDADSGHSLPVHNPVWTAARIRDFDKILS